MPKHKLTKGPYPTHNPKAGHTNRAMPKRKAGKNLSNGKRGR